jgi:hypothetical protein
MFDFEGTVKKLLGEASGTPPVEIPLWWRDIIKAYNDANPYSQVKGDTLPSTQPQLSKALNSALASASNIAQNTYSAAYVPLMDLVRSLYKTFLTTINNCDTFVSQLDKLINDPKTGTAIKAEIEAWKKRNLDHDLYGTDAGFLDKTVQDAEIKRKKDLDVAGDVAVTTIQGYCILPAVQTIVNRRTSVIARAAALKGLNNPFATVLYNIFNKTYMYVSGQAPISDDWDKIVDGNLYIKTVIMIAIYTRLLYESLKCSKQEEAATPTSARTGGKVAGAPLSQTPNAVRKRAARAAAKQGPTTESFYQTIENLLWEAIPANNSSKEEIHSRIMRELDSHKYNMIKSLPEDTHFMDFVEKGLLAQFNCDVEGGGPIEPLKDDRGNIKYYEEVPGKPKIFTVGEIDKMAKLGNKEAKNLMDQISNAAQYQRENTGVMDRMAAGANAAAGLAAVGGIKAGLAG